MSSRLTYPAVVPSGVREDLEARIAASLEQVTEANAADVLCEVLLAVIVTMAPLARQEPAWWAAHWPAMMHAWIRELSEASRLRLLGPQVVALGDRMLSPPDAIDRETFTSRMSDAVRVSPAGTRSEELLRELEPAIAAPAAVPPRDDSGKWWTVSEIVKAFDVHPETIRRQIRAGALHAVKLSPRSTRVPQSEIDRLIETNRLRSRS